MGSSFKWEEPPDDHAKAISERFEESAIRKSSLKFELDRTATLVDSHSIHLRYRGIYPITTWSAVYNKKNYRPVSCGIGNDWLDLDRLVADILLPDVEKLREYLLDCASRSHKSSNNIEMHSILRDIMQRRLNRELIVQAVSGESNNIIEAMVDDSYRQRFAQAVAPSLQKIYKQGSLETLWPVPAVVSTLVLATWLFDRAILGLLIALTAIPASISLIGLGRKQVLRKVFGKNLPVANAIAYVEKIYKMTAFNAGCILPTLLVLAVACVGVLYPRSGHLSKPSAATGIPNRPASSASVIELGTSSDASGLKEATDLIKLKEFAKARHALVVLAKKGYAPAYLPLAKLLMRDESGAFEKTHQIDMRASLNWSLKAVDAFPKNAEANYIAGLAAESGLGKSPDMAVANHLFRRGAELGDTDAMNSLGLSYITGTGVRRSDKKARYWFSRSAERGNAEALFNLGLMDWEGRARTAPDRATAISLWRRAAALGSERAKEMLSKLGGQTQGAQKATR